MKNLSTDKLLRRVISLLSLVFWALVLLGFNSVWVAVLTLLCALIHEGGHLIGLWLVGYRAPGPRAVLAGLRIRIPELLSYKQELTVLSLGPLFNIAVGGALLLLFRGEFLFTFALLNLFTALSNLLPIESYDGYRIAEALIGLFSLGEWARGALRVISFAFIAAMTFFTLYLVLRVGEGFWIFAIFFYSMLRRVFSSLDTRTAPFPSASERKVSFHNKNGDFGRI
ncbi:MAG: hypothetical protein IIX96_02095 [Clostridia bacterium]|nr:hypothetical protein [Clostridia bacterium]